MEAMCFAVLERPLDGIDASSLNKKWPARAIDDLDAVAKELGGKPLSSFFSMSPTDFERTFDFGDIEPEDVDQLPEDLRRVVTGNMETFNTEWKELMQGIRACKDFVTEEWFEASLGAQAITELVKFIRTDTKRFDEPDELASELEAAEQILRVAAKQGVRFHLSVAV